MSSHERMQRLEQPWMKLLEEINDDFKLWHMTCGRLFLYKHENTIELFEERYNPILVVAVSVTG